MGVEKRFFGVTSGGQETTVYRIGQAEDGLAVEVTDFGATVVSILVPDRDKKIRDVVLGYDDAAGYENGGMFLGACVGRCANRIKDAEFLIGGKRYILARNDGANNLHSGPDTYNKRVWQCAKIEENAVTFSLFSPDMDQGFPGDMEIRVRYAVNGKQFEISYYAVSDRDTVANFTNHSYFNLNGHDGKGILEHLTLIHADSYTEVKEDLIPSGRLPEVKDTAFDFTVRKAFGQDIGEGEGKVPLYDHNFALRGEGFRMIAGTYSKDSGILMNVYTDRPGVQLFTPPDLEITGKGGTVYGKFSAFCFETQFFPDALHQPGFASPILRADTPFESRTVYEFETVDEKE